MRKHSAKAAAKSKRRTVEEDTDLVPVWIAETVIDQAAAILPDALAEALFARRDEVAAVLARRAEVVYAANERFAKKLRGAGNLGRNTLYVFMEHWLGAWLKRNMPAAARALPRGYGWDYSPSMQGREREVQEREKRRTRQ